MEILNVVVAAAAGWIVGAVWYMRLGQRWMAAAGLTEEAVNSKDPLPYVTSFVCLVVVAGMTRHIFAMAGIVSVGGGLVAGLGLGLFIAAPWILTNYVFARRPKDLIWIDGGYATLGSAVMGVVLNLF